MGEYDSIVNKLKTLILQLTYIIVWNVFVFMFLSVSLYTFEEGYTETSEQRVWNLA